MTFPCPSCGATLEQAGVVTVSGAEFPVFQCDTCTRQADILGELVEVALTFAVGSDGKAFDPST